MRGRAGQLAPAWPLVLKRVHCSFTGPRPCPVHNRLGQLVHGELGLRQGIADGRDDLVGLLGGESDRFGMHRDRGRQGR